MDIAVIGPLIAGPSGALIVMAWWIISTRKDAATAAEACVAREGKLVAERDIWAGRFLELAEKALETSDKNQQALERIQAVITTPRPI